jgi:NAD(P)-dependent dehydrogenase (short-subunit alcohol dehydrogenase family)
MVARTILLSGATGKFGRVYTQYLLSCGHTVIGISSTQQSLQKLIVEYDLSNKNFYGLVVDLCKEDSSLSVVDMLKARDLMPDCLINNARSFKFLETGQSGAVSRENFLNEYLLDVVVPYELSLKLNEYSSRLKTILNIGSQYGVVATNPRLYDGPENGSPIHYGVAKAALSHLTKELAVRLAEFSIQVSCIAYGGVEGRVNAKFKERYAEFVPLGRMLNENEIVWPLDLLLSEKSAPMTGQTLNFDGGWTIW